MDLLTGSPDGGGYPRGHVPGISGVELHQIADFTAVKYLFVFFLYLFHYLQS